MNGTYDNVIKHIEREDLDDDARVLVEVGLEDERGRPTEKGTVTLTALLYKRERRDLADKCRGMRAARAAKEAAKRGETPEDGASREAAAKARKTAAKNGTAGSAKA